MEFNLCLSAESLSAELYFALFACYNRTYILHMALLAVRLQCLANFREESKKTPRLLRCFPIIFHIL